MTSLNVSQLDPSKQITNNLWAVTLIKDEEGNHARLAIEGERYGELFKTLAHLTGGSSTGTVGSRSEYEESLKHGSCCFFHTKGRVKLIDLKGKTIRYGAKTKTWQVTRDRVEAMLVRIRLEEDSFTTDKQNRVPFSIFGSESSCTQAAKYYEIHDPELAALREKDEKLFKSIVRQSKEKPCKDSIGEIRESMWMMWPLFIPIPVVNMIVGVVYLEVKHKYFSLDSERDRLVGLAKTAVVEHCPQPNNCFTWARGHLRSIGIDIPSKTIDIFAAITSRYTS